MKNPVSGFQKGRRRLTFPSLRVVVIVLTLLIIVDQAKSLSASEPMTTKNEMNFPGNMQIVFEKDLLSVSLKDADFEEALKEIGRQSKIKIDFIGSIKDPVKKKVTLKFVNIPLEKGLSRLLKNQNYSFTYLGKKDPADKKTRYVLSRVIVVGKSTLSQRTGSSLLVSPEEAHVDPLSQAMELNVISAEMIHKLLSQDPELQEKTLKTLSETINSSLKLIDTDLIEALGQADEKIKEDFPSEALNRFLFERLSMEEKIEKIKSMVSE